MRENEIWKDISGYEGLYQVSNFGNVRVLDRFYVVNNRKAHLVPGRVLKKIDNGNGYDYITLHKDGRRKNHYVHRLVAMAFLEMIPGKEYVNHIDYNRKNNNIENLEWCTCSENLKHSSIHMRNPKNVKNNSGERYIHVRNPKSYEVTVNRKYLGKFATIEEAIRERDKYIEKIGYY